MIDFDFKPDGITDEEMIVFNKVLNLVFNTSSSKEFLPAHNIRYNLLYIKEEWDRKDNYKKISNKYDILKVHYRTTYESLAMLEIIGWVAELDGDEKYIKSCIYGDKK